MTRVAWIFLAALAALAALATASPGRAQTPAAEAAWPGKPIRFIVPFPAGSSTDTAARLVGQRLGKGLGQPLVIDNRSGASGNIGVEAAAKAAPDGYTIVLGTTSTHAVATTLNAQLGYDPVRDFAPVSLIGSSPYVLVVHPSVAAKDLKELIALARAKPKALNYASAGSASLAHLAGELFAKMAGVKLTHIPYKSSALAVIDITNGRIEMQFGTIGPTQPHIRSGKLRAIGVTGATRVFALPEVPTLDEAGLPGYEAVLWMGILAPAGTPSAVIMRLNKDMAAVLDSGDVREALVAQGLEPTPITPEAFADYIRKEIVKWRDVVKLAGILPE
jgi:tripartite-type tricarboxylate transporter receptor subunit TctC